MQAPHIIGFFLCTIFQKFHHVLPTFDDLFPSHFYRFITYVAIVHKKTYLLNTSTTSLRRYRYHSWKKSIIVAQKITSRYIFSVIGIYEPPYLTYMIIRYITKVTYVRLIGNANKTTKVWTWFFLTNIKKIPRPLLPENTEHSKSNIFYALNMENLKLTIYN